jgi:hypothetical protein
MEQLIAEARAQSALGDIRQVAPPSRPSSRVNDGASTSTQPPPSFVRRYENCPLSLPFLLVVRFHNFPNLVANKK